VTLLLFLAFVAVAVAAFLAGLAIGGAPTDPEWANLDDFEKGAGPGGGSPALFSERSGDSFRHEAARRPSPPVPPDRSST
jgi:hypothetical protein